MGYISLPKHDSLVGFYPPPPPPLSLSLCIDRHGLVVCTNFRGYNPGLYLFRADCTYPLAVVGFRLPVFIDA